MLQTLIVRLPAPGHTEAEWLTVDATGAQVGATQRGALAAAATAHPARVVALAPAAQVLLAAPELPPGNAAKLARVVPFALEEQLTEDVERLCFAIGRRAPNGTTPVAVVARATLEAWIADLRAAGLEADALYADIALLPDNPTQTVLWLEGERLAVRRPGALPFLVEAAPLADALAVSGVIADPDVHGAEPRPLESAILHLTREDWGRVQTDVERLAPRFETLKVQLLPDGALPWLARALPARDALNLLQGEFARTQPYAQRWREWRVAAFLGLALLATHIAAQAIEIRLAHRQSAALDRQIEQLYASTMPSEPMRDARRQMQSRLHLIRASAAGPERFLRTMQALATAIRQSPQTSVESFAFREDALDLTVAAKSVDGLSQLSQALGRQGFKADIQSSTPGKDGVEGHLRVHAPGGVR